MKDLRGALLITVALFLHGLLILACTVSLGLLQRSANTHLSSMVDHTRELASTTRVHYEPATFQVSVSDSSLTYADGHGVPACAEHVRLVTNGDEMTLEDLVVQGYYVINTTTHSQTGNQHNYETGRIKSESETGYISCDTTGILYILRKDVVTAAADDPDTPPPA